MFSIRCFAFRCLASASLALVLGASACQVSQAPAPTQTLPAPQVTIVTSVPPTLTPSPTPVPTTEEWIYPYTIEGLRHHDYQNGEVAIGDVLVETELFTRYAISYLSDGLTITVIMQG